MWSGAAQMCCMQHVPVNRLLMWVGGCATAASELLSRLAPQAQTQLHRTICSERLATSTAHGCQLLGRLAGVRLGVNVCVDAVDVLPQSEAGDGWAHRRRGGALDEPLLCGRDGAWVSVLCVCMHAPANDVKSKRGGLPAEWVHLLGLLFSEHHIASYASATPLKSGSVRVGGT